MHHALAIEHQAGEQLELERADEEVALPLREGVAGVEGHARGRDRGRPLQHRRRHVRALAAGADLAAGDVFAAVGDLRPAVVAPGERAVHLVAALRAVLVGPQLAGERMHGRALHVAVAPGPDLGARVGAPGERVVGGHAAVGLDAHHLAEMAVERLGALAMVEAVAQGHEQASVAREHQARAPVVVARGVLVLREDALHALQAQAVDVEPRARHRGTRAARGRLGVGEHDHAVTGEVWPEHDVEQAALPARMDRGDTGDGFRDAPVRIDDAHAPGALGHQEATVGQEGERPGALQAARDLRDAQRARLARVQHAVGGSARGERAAGGERADHQRDTQQTARTLAHARKFANLAILHRVISPGSAAAHHAPRLCR